MNAQLSSLMEKEISRKEFLGMSALAVGSIFGLGSIIKLLSGKSLTLPTAGNPHMTSGYSSGAYGGAKDGR